MKLKSGNLIETGIDYAGRALILVVVDRPGELITQWSTITCFGLLLACEEELTTYRMQSTLPQPAKNKFFKLIGNNFTKGLASKHFDDKCWIFNYSNSWRNSRIINNDVNNLCKITTVGKLFRFSYPNAKPTVALQRYEILQSLI